MSKKCPGVHRTVKGDRMLVAMTTDPDGAVAREFLRSARGVATSLCHDTDEMAIAKLVKMLTQIPRRCSMCGQGGD